MELAPQGEHRELQRPPNDSKGEFDVGATQLVANLDTLGLNEGWRFVFDLDATRSWDERLWQRELERDGKWIRVRGG